MDADIIGILVGGLIVLIPVAGVTARYTLKPLIDSLIKISESRLGSDEVKLLSQRLSLLEQELGSMRSDMGRLEEERAFYRQLEEPKE